MVMRGRQQLPGRRRAVGRNQRCRWRSGKGAGFVSVFGAEGNNRDRGGAQRLGSWADAVRRTWPGRIVSLEIEKSPRAGGDSSQVKSGRWLVEAGSQSSKSVMEKGRQRRKRPETREDEKGGQRLRRVSVDNKWEGKRARQSFSSYRSSSGLAAADDSAGITQLNPAGTARLACAKIP